MSPAYPYYEDINWGLLRLWGKRSGLRVLDVGCGFATTTERIQALGNRVTGVDSSAEAFALASQRIERTVHADVRDVATVIAQIGGDRFDAIIFADMLEHLPDPSETLRAYLPLLAEGGSVFVSLPNIALWSVRLSIAVGRFEYQDTGVLDRTHLRFFTRNSARRLLREAGLDPTRVTYNPGLVRPFVPLIKRATSEKGGRLLDSKPYRFYLAAVHPVERLVASLWPGMLAFQMIFEARRAR
jgi:2-polyprenyl-3-methyl-5-hydroxy-6-metoxy-1,4-benzoquinol methylase